MNLQFQNAKVIGDGITYKQYSSQPMKDKVPAKRGDKEFIMSRGELMEFAHCPSRWRAGFNSDPTPATDWGSVVDCLALTPDQFEKRYAVASATYYDEKSGKDKPWNWVATHCKNWRDEKEHDGFEIVKSETFEQAKIAVAKLMANKFIADLFACSKRQVMVTGEYHDEATKLVIPVRCLIDLVPDHLSRSYGNMLSDLKTARDAAPRHFEKAIFEFDYDVQAWLSLALYNLATGEYRNGWQLVIQENIEPFETPEFQPFLSTEYLQIGEARLAAALKFYAQCLAHNAWPSYAPPPGRLIIGCTYAAAPPIWAFDNLPKE